MKRIALAMILAFSWTSMAFSLTLDTNDLTNVIDAETLSDSEFITMTNLSWDPILQPRIPNSYLATGELEFEEPEKPLRRFDITFFISMPITFFLFQNLFLFHNQVMQNVDGYSYVNPLENKQQRSIILINTLFIPAYVAWQDYIYMKAQTEADEYNPYSEPNLEMGIYLLHTEF